ncbi:hypothetical protein HGRIS_005285 [Hohenbuehelia grisea]|uniref:FAD-binding PCMH-type domain-containing protein n=1 Tax=Hohenbuehelia grisea TaxID=104357 RepID=A0ABR3JFF1_9AGAR
MAIVFVLHRFGAFVLLLSSVASASVASLDRRGRDPICKQIADKISSASQVYYPGQSKYFADIKHWASSSSQFSKCSVEPGTAADIGIILGIVGSTKTPFAVKGGGHASNPGFSSTEGVHIAMTRFSEVSYDKDSQTVQVGAGLVWDQVYEALEPHGVNVVGGRVSGVGVAGFTLGGGYSWKTNQYGLTVDTVTAYELVKPDGSVARVTEDSDPELFSGLKGGGNNFGIVTQFTLKTFPQTRVWGGLITYTADQIDKVVDAAAKFSSEVTDPKASMISAFNFLLGQPGVSQLLFYDGPSPPPGVFDDFLKIPHLTKDVKTRSFLSLVTSSPSDATAGTRGIFHSAPVLGYSPTFLKAVVNESVHWGQKLAFKSASFISYDVEPFLPSLLTHTSSRSAYPPSRSTGFLPLNLYFAWTDAHFDGAFHDAVRASASHLTELAISEGQSLDAAPIYPNYAIFGTPLESIYGSNLAALQGLKAKVDPENVMGLAGGFKIAPK